MARMIDPDEIDFGAYMRQTEPAMKVREASVFAEELAAEFVPRTYTRHTAAMHSTKLGRELEHRPGEVTVWAGYNGHRKSMLTGQVAVDLCASGQRVLMASMEMQPGRTLGRMARQALAASCPSRRMTDEFSRWTDGRLWIFDHIGRLNPQLCMAVLRYFADELQGQHVFIDSMMMVCASEESLDEQKQFTTDLIRCAVETGLHIHLVAHCRKPQDDSKPPTKYDLRGSAAISDQAHNVVTVWANKDKVRRMAEDANDASALAQPDAIVSVEKQRNGEFEGRLKLWFDHATFRFMNDRGSRVEPLMTIGQEEFQ